jgi:hypothetical protein
MFSVIGWAVLTPDDCTDEGWYFNNSTNQVSGHFISLFSIHRGLQARNP